MARRRAAATSDLPAPTAAGAASASPPALSGSSSGAAARRRRSSGRCQRPWRPGRLPAEGASKRIAPGRGPEQRGGRRRVEHRPGPQLGERAQRGRPRGTRPGEVGEHQRAQLPRALGAGERNARAGPAQRAGELIVGAAQARGRAERDDQHVERAVPSGGRRRDAQVTAPFTPSTRLALKPGVRSSAIGRSGEVRRT